MNDIPKKCKQTQIKTMLPEFQAWKVDALEVCRPIERTLQIRMHDISVVTTTPSHFLMYRKKRNITKVRLGKSMCYETFTGRFKPPETTDNNGDDLPTMCRSVISR